MPGLSLPASYRIKKRTDFIQIKSSGRKTYSEHFILYSFKSEFQHPRLAVVVSKKVSKRAVDRNLVKRRIREIFRLNQLQLANFDLIVIAKKNCLATSYLDLSTSLLATFNKAKVLKNVDK